METITQIKADPYIKKVGVLIARDGTIRSINVYSEKSTHRVGALWEKFKNFVMEKIRWLGGEQSYDAKTLSEYFKEREAHPNTKVGPLVFAFGKTIDQIGQKMLMAAREKASEVEDFEISGLFKEEEPAIEGEKNAWTKAEPIKAPEQKSAFTLGKGRQHSKSRNKPETIKKTDFPQEEKLMSEVEDPDMARFEYYKSRGKPESEKGE